MNISDLKKSRIASSKKLLDEVEKLNSKSFPKDPRFWYPALDNSKNGFAIIRFLSAPNGEELPFVRLFSHGFEGNGWYFNNCPTTINEKCPACESNSVLWKSGIEANKEIVTKFRKRRLTYISNILVVSDPKNPENEGKVFLFKYGKQVHDILMDRAKADELDPSKVVFNPFDMWDGGNFKLKIRQKEGYTNYDKSEFEGPSPLGTDDQISEIWAKTHALLPFVAPKEFKSFDELQKALDRVLGKPSNATQRAEELPVREAPVNSRQLPPRAQPLLNTNDDAPFEGGVVEDPIDYFSKIAAE